MLYKGYKIVPYCPRCGTPLSSHEVAQGYKDVKEKSAIVRFKVKDEDAYILAWTTTPWTLPSNVALCVNPDETYVKVKAADGFTYYMAEALVDTCLLYTSYIIWKERTLCCLVWMCFRTIEVRDWREPVSYTHLDVYKRQRNGY